MTAHGVTVRFRIAKYQVEHLMKRIALVDPNMSAALTTLMVEIARECAPDNLQIEGLTGSFGAPLITCDAELDEAADAVRALAPELARRADAVIVSALATPAPTNWAVRSAGPWSGSLRPACARRPRMDVASPSSRTRAAW